MPDEQRYTLIAVGVGAGVGALVGSATGGGAGAIAAGAAIGGVTGGIIGPLIRPGACYFVNRRGELWQYPCGYSAAGAKTCFHGRPGWLEPMDCPAGKRHRVR